MPESRSQAHSTTSPAQPENAGSVLEPPRAPEHPVVHDAHGHQRPDEFAWMADRDHPELRPHLEAENRYLQSTLGCEGEALREALFAEMKARIPRDYDSQPQIDGPYWYWTRERGDLEYSQHCRRPSRADGSGPEGPEEIYLDENELAQASSYFSLESLAVAPDHQRAAYAVDTSGDEISTIHIIDLSTRARLEHAIENTTGAMAWTPDGRWLLYDQLDEAHRPFQIKAHRMGTTLADDIVVYEETDEAFHLSLYGSRSERLLIVDASSQVTTELRVMIFPQDPAAAGDTLPELIALHPRKAGVEASIVHAGEHVYTCTNDGAAEFCVRRCPLDQIESQGSAAQWQTVIAGDSEIYIEGLEGFRNHLVVWERVMGLGQVRIVDLRQLGDTLPCPQRPGTRLKFEDSVYCIDSAWTAKWSSPTIRISYESMRTPPSLYAVDLDTLERKRLRTAVVVGGYLAEAYRTERIWATAKDGTRVPISLVYHREDACGSTETGPETGPARPRPLLLYGYGAYGGGLDPSFSRARISLLDRGVTFAIAHVRGGNEMGRHWYDGGKLKHKTNSFGDFIACAEHLVAEGYTTPGQLAAEGGSAGGLLMGAVANSRPDLFHAIIAEVPFVDMLTSMSQPDLPLTVVEYEEWGDPSDPEDYANMAAYSPYDNVHTGPYPHILALGALADPRVGYWEPTKWIARLRKRDTGDGEFLLWTHLDAGHSGSSGRFEALRDVALEYAFLLRHLPHHEPATARSEGQAPPAATP